MDYEPNLMVLNDILIQTSITVRFIGCEQTCPCVTYGDIFVYNLNFLACKKARKYGLLKN